MSSHLPDRPPRLVVALSYAGLIPFIALTLAIWFAPPVYIPELNLALNGYSAVILSFLGAIHWGLAMRANAPISPGLLVFSVLPALLAWLLLLIPMDLALLLFAAGFVLVYLVDYQAVRLNLAPVWYPGLRKPLTLVVVICLLLTAFSSNT